MRDLRRLVGACGGLLVVCALAPPAAAVAADWKERAVKKAVGKAAREGLEEAAKNAAMDAALDAALPDSAAELAKKAQRVDADDIADDVKDAAEDSTDRARDRADDALKRIDDIDSRDVIGAVAGEGVENALLVADMANTLDDVHDAAKTVNKVNKLRRRLK